MKKYINNWQRKEFKVNYQNLLKLKVMIERSKHHESEEFDELLDEIKVNKTLKHYIETKMFMLPSDSVLGYGFYNLMLTVSTDEEKPSFQKLQFYWFMLDTGIKGKLYLAQKTREGTY